MECDKVVVNGPASRPRGRGGCARRRRSPASSLHRMRPAGTPGSPCRGRWRPRGAPAQHVRRLPRRHARLHPSAANRIAAGVAGPSYLDATAPNGITLYYRVRAENNETCSSRSNGGVVDAWRSRLGKRPDRASRPSPGDSLRVNGISTPSFASAGRRYQGRRRTTSTARRRLPVVRADRDVALSSSRIGIGHLANSWYYAVKAATRAATRVRRRRCPTSTPSSRVRFRLLDRFLGNSSPSLMRPISRAARGRRRSPRARAGVRHRILTRRLRGRCQGGQLVATDLNEAMIECQGRSCGVRTSLAAMQGRSLQDGVFDAWLASSA